MEPTLTTCIRAAQGESTRNERKKYSLSFALRGYESESYLAPALQPAGEIRLRPGPVFLCQPPGLIIEVVRKSTEARGHPRGFYFIAEFTVFRTTRYLRSDL